MCEVCVCGGVCVDCVTLGHKTHEQACGFADDFGLERLADSLLWSRVRARFLCRLECLLIRCDAVLLPLDTMARPLNVQSVQQKFADAGIKL